MHDSDSKLWKINSYKVDFDHNDSDTENVIWESTEKFIS